ncbi:lysine/arginine/ornithine-binding periplasmic protein-like [Ptychodera flava]|uniref:lysine/arginine/ornithine-binding periplasmic protein-like n=1 Tax=Ptychodera flava TaxID=63121 RepID=UPI00396A6E59
MDDRTYSFLVDVVCNCSFYYQDEHDHKVKGFFVDLLDEVCREAGKKCVVQQQPYRQCYVSGTDEGVQPVGVGILSRQFDGCVVSKTSGIANSMSFTDKFQDIKGQSRFFVPVGNPWNFNPDDISGKTIGFINGWYSDPRCLLENKLKGTETLKREQMRFFDHGQLWSNLQNNVIDAAFVLLMPENGVDDKDAGMLGGTETGLEPIGDVINCLDGLQVGARKDSDMVDWFNGALRKLKQSGKFAKLCRKAQIDHGARGPVIDCIF